MSGCGATVVGGGSAAAPPRRATPAPAASMDRDGSARRVSDCCGIAAGGALSQDRVALSCYRTAYPPRHDHVHEYLERILKARVYDVAIESPLEDAPRLSRRLGNHVLFKREDLQPVFSFKVRGAYNKIAHLSETTARRGVICASAGNHAQGVALAARRRGIPATIVMPQTTPQHQGAGGASTSAAKWSCTAMTTTRPTSTR